MGLAQAVKNGSFVITAECRPPRGAGTSAFKDAASALAGCVDAICAPESEDGVRLSSLASCVHLAQAGAEPVLHILTRDMNQIALQSTILGAVSMGVKNVLCLSGRHQALTSSASARGVYDIDPVQLLRIANGMRAEGRLADGQMLDEPVDILLGADTNPFSDPVELQVIALEKAVAAGVDFVITQPVFNLDRFNIWMSHVRERGISEKTCIIASVMPLTSSQQAVQLAEHYTSIDIGDDVVERLDSAQDKRSAGVHLASEVAAYVRRIEGVRGVHIMAGGDPALAAEVAKSAALARS